jgi:biotin transport system permease protein
VIGLYVPGTSPVHRAPAGLKLALLVAGLAVLGIWRTPLVTAAGLAVLAVVAALSRVGLRPVLAQVRPVLWIVVVVFAAQVWLADLRTAVVVVGSMVLAVAAAGVVTLTTRTQDLLDAVVFVLRPLRRLGVDPDRVGLVLALTIRSVPVLVGLAEEVRDARKARGAERSLRAFAVPFVVRSVRHADRLGEALAARGVDD